MTITIIPSMLSYIHFLGTTPKKVTMSSRKTQPKTAKILPYPQSTFPEFLDVIFPTQEERWQYVGRQNTDGYTFYKFELRGSPDADRSASSEHEYDKLWISAPFLSSFEVPTKDQQIRISIGNKRIWQWLESITGSDVCFKALSQYAGNNNGGEEDVAAMTKRDCKTVLISRISASG